MTELSLHSILTVQKYVEFILPIMRWVKYVVREITAYKMVARKPEGKRLLERYLGIVRREILKCISNKYNVRV
jgi:hypothetical protein